MLSKIAQRPIICTLLYLLFQEVESSEEILTKELREGTRDIAANNVEFLHSFAKGKIQSGTVKKMTAITIRIINSIIRSIQMTINSKRFHFFGKP